MVIKPEKLRKLKKRHPKFFRSNYGRKNRKRVKENWRRPRGGDNKKRMKLKHVGAEPNIGYRKRRDIRGLHPSGYEEVRVRNVDELKNVDGKYQAIRIAASVGRRKREEIIKKAVELGIKILNR